MKRLEMRNLQKTLNEEKLKVYLYSSRRLLFSFPSYRCYEYAFDFISASQSHISSD